MKRFLWTVLCGLGIAQAGSTSVPGSVRLNPDPGQYQTYSFTSEQGSWEDEYVGPYPATIQVGGGSYRGSVICFDIHNTDYMGWTYGGTFRRATTTADFEAAWIIQQMNAALASGLPLTGQNVGPYDTAVWQVEFPSSNNWNGGTFPYDLAAQNVVEEAALAVANGYRSGIPIFVPDEANSQRYGVSSIDGYDFPRGFSGSSPVPEPGSLALIASGMFGAAGAVRRWQRR